VVVVFVVWQARRAEREREGPVHAGRSALSWAKDLNHPFPASRSRAQEAIQSLGAAAVPSLLIALGQRDSVFLRPYEGVSERIPRRLRAWMYHGLHPYTAREHRVAAAAALGLLGTNVPPEPLASALGDPEYQVRMRASEALGRMGAAAVPAVRQVVDSRRAEARLHACWTLGLMGTNAAPAVPDLVACLGDRSADVARVAADALLRVGIAAVPELLRVVRSGTTQDRLDALAVLQRMGGGARFAIPELVGSLRDPDPAVRAAVVTAIASIWPFAEESVGVMSGALGDPAPEVRAAAAAGLGRAAPLAKSAVPALERLRDDPEESVRTNAVKTLERIKASARR